MNYEQQQTIVETERSYNSTFHKLMRMFTLSILVSFIGTFVGMEFVPAWMYLPLVVVELVMLISAFFIRRKGRAIGYGFVYAFCFISGIVLFPTINHYARMGGSSLITTAFALTAVIFGVLSVYAYYSKRDFSFLGGFLMVGVLTLIGFGIVAMFVPSLYTGPLGLTIAGAGVLIFSGYILYDVSQYKHGLAEEAIPLAVLNLYLDFINLFLYLLRLLGILQDD